MSKKKKSAIIHQIQTVKYKMGHKEPRKGLFTYHTQKAPTDSVDGWFAAMKEMCSPDEPTDPKQTVIDRIESMENSLNDMRKAADDPRDNPDQWTVSAQIDSTLRVLKGVRRDVDVFEAKYKDDPLSFTFYNAIDTTLSLCGSIEKLTLKRYEDEILKGRAVNSGNKRGASKQKQKDAVRRVLELTNEGMKQGLTEKKARAHAVKSVATESGVTPPAVYGWINNKKINSAVVVTKIIGQDAE